MYLHHTAVEYHYLKSKILQISNKYFDDWEKTHLFTTKIATSILVISFIILITTLFNINIGLISSIIIIPYVTIGYGFHFTNGAHDLAQIFGIFSIVALKSNGSQTKSGNRKLYENTLSLPTTGTPQHASSTPFLP